MDYFKGARPDTICIAGSFDSDIIIDGSYIPICDRSITCSD